MSEENHCDSATEKLVDAATKEPSNVKLLVATFCACAFVIALGIAIALNTGGITIAK